ncbi:MAG: carboxynorspermidine decarboxylase [Eubacteriales bacterium]|nr:carboxynorspermidine decarboxylase [Eubacteriales bacterium]
MSAEKIQALLEKQANLAALRTRLAPSEIDFTTFDSPAFITDERLLRANLELLKELAELAGVKILLAQKAYSLYETYPLIAEYLAGAAASGYNEARLAYEAMGKEVQVYSPAYAPGELEAVLPCVDKLIFNRYRQIIEALPLVEAERARRRASGDSRELSIGLRLNPEYSEVETDLYNPAAPGSRLGTTASLLAQDLAAYALERGLPEDSKELYAPLSGIHLHCLCEENFQPLKGVVDALEAKFPELLKQVEWVNLGGGHHLTRADYDLKALVPFLREFKARHNLAEVYLEPGEAICYDAGWLLCSVLDFQPNQLVNAILDVSATCHTPDVLEMPYRPRLFAVKDREVLAGEAAELAYSYRLGGPSCLAGDSFGDYSFGVELARGDRLVFCDMALYTHVKTTMFNGMAHPDLVLYRGPNQPPRLLKRFGFKDFAARLGGSDPAEQK